MANTFIFKEETYTETNALGIAFSDHFASALEIIFENPKKLVKFLKKKDKELAKKVIEDLAYSKYKNNAVTFIIYHLCQDHRVVINGYIYSFEEFCNCLKEHHQEQKAMMAFLEDFGISKTYAHDVNTPSFTDDMYTVEKNISDSFAFEYLCEYDSRNSFESVEGSISKVVNNDECFRHSSALFRDERFQLALAYKYSLKKVLTMRACANPLFEGIKMIALDFDVNDLTKLISDTFYWWLFDNYNKYMYFKTAKAINERFFTLAKMKKQYDKNPSLPLYADISRALYENYINFAIEMNKGFIMVNKKYEKDDFLCDKPYCQTFICLDFMKDHIVKLTGSDPEEVEETAEEDQKEIAVDNSYTTSISTMKEVSDKKCRKQDKGLKRLKRYSLHLPLFALLLTLVGVFCFLALMVEAIGKVLPFTFYKLGDIFAYAMFGAFGLSVILAITLRIRLNKTEAALNDFMLLRTLRAKTEPLTAVQEKNYNVIVKKEAKINKRAFRSHFILSTLMLISLAYIGACVGYYAWSAVVHFAKIETVKTFEENQYMFLLGAPALALLYGIFRKRKGYFTVLLFVLLSVASSIAIAYFMK